MSVLPTSVQIAGLDITIKGVRNLTGQSDGAGLDGHWVPDKLLIEINTILTPQAQEATLYHELFHAVLDVMGEEISKDERFVEAVGQLWYQVSKTLEYD